MTWRLSAGVSGWVALARGFACQCSFGVSLCLVGFGQSDATEGVAEMLAEVCSIEAREATATTVLFAQSRQQIERHGVELPEVHDHLR